MRPTGTGLVVGLGGGALAATGLTAGLPTLVGIGAAGLTLMLGAVALVLLPARLDVTRAATRTRLTVGDAVRAGVTVVNAGRLPTGVFEILDSFDGEPQRIAVPPLAPGARFDDSYEISTRRRGVIALGPVRLERRDPLGLVRRGEPLAPALWIWVHPKIHPLKALPIGVAVDFEGEMIDRAQHGSTAFASLREYRAGDDFRQIHWRTTARVGDLVVQDRVDTTEPSTTVLLDTRAAVLSPERFEEAVAFAASVVSAAGRGGHPVTLLCTTPTDPPPVTALDRLAAAVQDGGDETGLLAMVRGTPGGGTIVVVSGEPGGLVPLLGAQRRRYARIVLVQIGDATGTSLRSGVSIISAPTAEVAAQAYTRLGGGR
ncbi:DUF58 domain-containing protein [Dactylosporangium sp. NPDC050588]|uniref:DUF58 domain-containing protein n=1 Tax=Dactylosporangium sp. NPDC050588 TaxID=3157211 RepID=UPI0033C87220